MQSMLNRDLLILLKHTKALFHYSDKHKHSSYVTVKTSLTQG